MLNAATLWAQLKLLVSAVCTVCCGGDRTNGPYQWHTYSNCVPLLFAGRKWKRNKRGRRRRIKNVLNKKRKNRKSVSEKKMMLGRNSRWICDTDVCVGQDLCRVHIALFARCTTTINIWTWWKHKWFDKILICARGPYETCYTCVLSKFSLSICPCSVIDSWQDQCKSFTKPKPG